MAESIKMTPAQLTDATFNGTLPDGSVELVAETDPNIISLLKTNRDHEQTITKLDAALKAVWGELLPNAPPQILGKLESEHPVLAELRMNVSESQLCPL